MQFEITPSSKDDQLYTEDENAPDIRIITGAFKVGKIPT